MSDDHLQTKVKEAIASTDGHKQDAQKLLITWAVRDPSLLLAMTKPYLKAIAAGLVDYALRVKDTGGSIRGATETTRTAIDDIVAAAAGHVPTDKRKKSNVPPPKSTERQASAMRRLADAFKKKS